MINRGNYKYVLIGILIVLGFFLINPSFTGMAGLEKSSKIDHTILDSFDGNDTVNVIIVLEEPKEEKGFKVQNVNKLEEKKQKVKKVQDDVLSTINYVNYSKEYKLKNKTNSKKNKITGLFVSDEQPDLELKNKYKTMNLLSGKVSKNGLKKLEANPNVKYIEINKYFETSLHESTNITQSIDVNEIIVNGNAITGKGQTVCVIDSGVDYTHPDMGGGFGIGYKVIDGYDYYNNDTDPMDDNGHGTHVAGIVASTNKTYPGVAPDAKIVAYKVCDNQGKNCGEDDIISSIDECILNSTKLNISVITMSLGGGKYTSPCDNDYPGITLSVNNAIANGIFVDASSGNGYNSDGLAAPACINNITSVGSVDKSDVIAISSDVASFLDILAPGVSITSLNVGGGLTVKSGTSMAAPHVAGAAALIYQYEKEINGRDATPQEIREILKRSDTIVNVTRAELLFPRLNVLDSINSILILNETANEVQDRKGNVKIKFTTNTNLTRSSQAITTNNNFINIDTINYPEFAGKGANLTLYLLPFEKTPIIIKNGVICSAGCIVIEYDGTNLTFGVTSFSNYTAGANSQLEIFDDVDLGIIRRTYQEVNFFANYTNVTSGEPISTGNCNISFSDGLNGTMIYSNGLFNFTRAFGIADLYTYNITCNDTDFETLKTTDDITVLPSCTNSTGQEVSQPLPNIDWIITNDNVTCNNANIYFQNQTLILGANAIVIINNSKLILNQSDNSLNINISSDSEIIFIDSEIKSKDPPNNFNIVVYGKINATNITTNLSQITIHGNKINSISNSILNDQVDFSNATNIFNNNIFNGIAYFSLDSKNKITENSFNYWTYFRGNTINEVKNSSFNNRTYFVQNSITNFTIPRSKINDIRFANNPTVYGYINMPLAPPSSFLSTTILNRYYPVHVNYTNGTPAVGKVVNITNGTHILFSGVTDSNGFVNPNLTWTNANKDLNYTIYVNPSQNISLLKDTPIIFILDIPSAPNVTLDSPANNTNITAIGTLTEVTLNFTVIDDSITLNCSLYLDGILNQTNNSVSNNTLTSFSINASLGTYSWNINCTDGELNDVSEIWYFTIKDETGPIVTALGCIPDPANVSDSVICYANITDDIGVDTVLANLTHANTSIIPQTVLCSGTINKTCNFTFTDTTEGGTYNIFWWANDTSSNTGTDNDNFNINFPNTPPEINLENPTNNTIINGETNTTLNFTVIDDYNTTLSCDLYINGILNQTNNLVQNNTLTSFPINISYGTYNWSINCTDGEFSNVSEEWLFTVVNCGNNIAETGEQCDGTDLHGETCNSLGYDKGTLSCTASCAYTGCSNNAPSGDSSSSSSGPIIPPKPPEENNDSNDYPIVEPDIIIPATPKNNPPVNPPVKPTFEQPKPTISLDGSMNRSGIIYLLAILALIIIILLPFFLLGRKTFAREKVIELLLEKDKLTDYRRIHVTVPVYERYKHILKEKKKNNNLLPIKLKKDDFKEVVKIKEKFNIDEELSKLIVAAKKGIFPKILVIEDVAEKVRDEFKKIKFERIEHNDKRDSKKK